MKILINAIDLRGSIANGPGIRIVVFLQGCSKRCPGCHNPQTWDFFKGIEYETHDLYYKILESNLRKITISGGEPLEQPEAVEEFIGYLKNFDIAIYTGFELQQIPEWVFKKTHHIKFGEYNKSKRITTVPYIGSKNQMFIDTGVIND